MFFCFSTLNMTCHPLPHILGGPLWFLVRIESPEINPHVRGQMVLTRVSRPLSWERRVFSTSDDGKTGNPHAKE